MLKEKILIFLIEFVCVSVFITLFFFYIGLKVEHDSVNEQIGMLTDEFIHTFKNPPILDLMNENQENFIPVIIENNQPLYSIDDHNNNITIYLGIIFAVIIGCICLLWYNFKHMNLNMKSILIENIVLFIFVGSFELYFFTHYVIKYVPILPSEIQTLLQEYLKEKIFGKYGDKLKTLMENTKTLQLIKGISTTLQQIFSPKPSNS